MPQPTHGQTARARSPIVWVAGVGASAGLGAAVARRFAREGLHAVLTGRNAERLEQVAAEIRASGAEATAAPGDVSDEGAVAAIASKVAELGPLQVAVFNAASADRAPTLELSPAQFESAWRTSTLGGFIFARVALRALLPAGRGTLLFTGATASLRGRPPFAAFAAAKAGLRSLSQTLAREFGAQGIHVAHVVIDGGIDGERLRTNAPRRTRELDLRPYKEPF